MKKILCLFVVFFLLTLSCTPLVLASFSYFDVHSVSVPFPEPSSPYVAMLCRTKTNSSEYVCRMWTFDFVIADNSYTIAPEAIRMWCEFDPVTYKLDVWCGLVDEIPYIADVTVYRQFYTWSSNNNYYRIYDTHIFNTGESNSFLLHTLDYDTFHPDTHVLDGFFVGNGLTYAAEDYVQNTHTITFNGQFNSSDMSAINNYLYLLYNEQSDSNDVLQHYLTIIDNKVYLIDEKLGRVVEILEDMHNVTPSETTTNGAVDELDKAEGDLMGDAFGNLDKVDMPTIQFNPGTNTGDAFLFIGSQLEALTSNAKFRTAIMIILSLSLCGFLLKILPNKGD